MKSAALFMLAALIPAPSGHAQDRSDDRPREPIIGRPCEGCEAVFEGLPATLPPEARIAPADQSGEPMRIEGTVFDEMGRPASGVIVYAYHTDQNGVYPPPEDGTPGQAAYRHGRLRAWAQTDSEGGYRFETIRPGSYPGRRNPAHVHMHVIEPGCCTYYIGDIQFEDDPLLTGEERRRTEEGRGGSGLVRPVRQAGGKWLVRRDIHLGRGVPDYPARRSTNASDPTLVDDVFLVTEPEWSHDGNRIVFAGGQWPDLDIWIVQVDTGKRSLVFRSDTTDYMPSWAPDDGHIVFASTRSGSHDLYVGPASGGSVARITADDTCDNTEPRWSPDGQFIAYRSDCDGNREVYKVRPDGTEPQRLTNNTDEDGEPSWSPDSRHLAFTSFRDGHAEVYTMDVDGSSPRRLTYTPSGYSRRAEWSPDGESISFGTNRDGNDEIYLMRSDGTHPWNVTRHDAREYYSRWSPDGRWIAFTSNRERRRNAIFITPTDGSRVRRIFP